MVSLYGWAAFGVAVRWLQMGIRQAPAFYYPQGYLISGGFWVGFGYFFNQWVDNNNMLLEKRLEKLKKTREEAV